MDLTTEDQFGESLAAQPAAPNFHTATLGDDVGNFAHDLTQPGFGQTGATVRAAASSAFENDLSFGVGDAWQQKKQFDPLVEAVNKDRGFLDRVSNPYFAGVDPRDYLQTGLFASKDAYKDYFWQQVAVERAKNPGMFGNLPKSQDELMASVRAEQRASHDYAQQLARTGGPITGTAANFAGSMVGGFADPVNLLATATGFPAADSLLKTALVEGGANTAVTLATLPSRAQHYQDIGEPMSVADMAGEVAGSAVMGAGIGVGGKLLGRVLGLKGHDLVSEFEAKNPDPAPTLRTAAAMVEDDANRAATSPFTDTAEGRDLHRQAIIATQGALDERRPDLLPDYSDHVEAAARASEPEAFATFEGAGAERDALRQQIDTLGAARQSDPQVAVLQGRISDILGKVNNVEDRLTVSASERLAKVRSDLDQVLTSDTPAMADLRQQLLAADVKMRDVGPRIAAARTKARASSPLGDGADFAGSFSTAKGSTYVQHSDGTTTRNKAARTDIGHEGQSGPQPRSEKTFYVTPEHADQLGLFQTHGGGRMAVEVRPDGAVGVKYLDGANAGKFERRTVHAVQSAPAPGLIPVETWRDGTRVHFGNEITEVRPSQHALPAAVEAPADRANHPRRHDPEALKPFTDPVRKPDAFHAQADDLARELAPAPERPAGTQAESRAGKGDKSAPDSGETGKPASESPSGSDAVSPYGDAAEQLAALDRLPEADQFADPVSGKTVTVKAAAADLKRQARAVERLRGCITGEG